MDDRFVPRVPRVRAVLFDQNSLMRVLDLLESADAGYWWTLEGSTHGSNLGWRLRIRTSEAHSAELVASADSDMVVLENGYIRVMSRAEFARAFERDPSPDTVGVAMKGNPEKDRDEDLRWAMRTGSDTTFRVR